jgi:predicted glycogen debranching enzyme
MRETSPIIHPTPSERHNAEWLETDGLGGFACLPIAGPRTRRYHGLLISATNPPADRSVLINGIDAWVTTSSGRYRLTQQRYRPDVLDPAAHECEIESFESEPWPRWRLRLPDGTRLEHEIFLVHGSPTLVMAWRVTSPASWGSPTLSIRPFLSARNYHALHRENSSFQLGLLNNNGVVHWRPYDALPGVVVRCNGWYLHEPLWYRNFLYEEERARGFDHAEDLASPGVFQFDLSQGEAVWIATPDSDGAAKQIKGGAVVDLLKELRSDERTRRQSFATPLHRAADHYLVKRGEGKTIIAGYPWFADWGRDTFIAMRGLCIVTGRLEDARQILLAWAGSISQGMLPNRFPDSSSAQASAPEYNSVDASLWYVIAIHEFLEAARRTRFDLAEGDRRTLRGAVQEILAGYCEGTRYGIVRDPDDGLLRAGERGQQLTWMDARVADREITPRIGKPVEVNALWVNALWIGSQLISRKWDDLFQFARASFRRRFWNAAGDFLYDVIDVDHNFGTVDTAIRPNQIFAVGGLPMPVLEGEAARSVVDIVERQLWTPMGLRSLASRDPQYVPHYVGGPHQRDGAYHQGTVWPWLAGAFIEAYVRVQGSDAQTKRAARVRFLEPLLQHVPEAGIGHFSEIADADAPHTPRGCPFQAWSLGEVLRLKLDVLRINERHTTGTPAATSRSRKRDHARNRACVRGATEIGR